MAVPILPLQALLHELVQLWTSRGGNRSHQGCMVQGGHGAGPVSRRLLPSARLVLSAKRPHRRNLSHKQHSRRLFARGFPLLFHVNRTSLFAHWPCKLRSDGGATPRLSSHGRRDQTCGVARPSPVRILGQLPTVHAAFRSVLVESQMRFSYSCHERSLGTSGSIYKDDVGRCPLYGAAPVCGGTLLRVSARSLRDTLSYRPSPVWETTWPPMCLRRRASSSVRVQMWQPEGRRIVSRLCYVRQSVWGHSVLHGALGWIAFWRYLVFVLGWSCHCCDL